MNRIFRVLLFCLLAAAPTFLPLNPVNGQGMPPTNPVSERLRDRARTFDAAESDIALQDIRKMLEGLDRVRVDIVVAPGNGHQSASIRLIQRLRELGFKGIVEVVYAENSARQLTTLIPGFDGWKSEQFINSKTLGYLELIGRKDFEANRNQPILELGFSAASDMPMSIYEYKRLHVKNMIHIQPRNWVRRSSERVIYLENRRAFDLTYLHRMGVTTTPPDLNDVEALLEPLASGKNFFRAFFARAPMLDIMPAYSIDFTEKPVKVMDMVLGGLEHAMQTKPGAFQKPVVIPIFTVFKDEKEREVFDESLKARGVQVLKATGPAVTERIQSLQPGEVLAIHVGLTPPPLFEAIVSRATLPVILEGKNLTQMSLDHGLPILNVIGNQRDFDQEMYDRRMDTKMASLVHSAFNAFDDKISRFGGSDKRAIGEYILELRKPGSELREFFSSLKADPKNVSNDLLAQSLLELREARRYAATKAFVDPRSQHQAPVSPSDVIPRGAKRCHQLHALQF